jgi:Predicted Fe-S oxidoreductases
MGIPVVVIVYSYKKNEKSLSNIVKKVLEAEIIENEGKVYINRTCPDHGDFSYLYWDDADAWRRYEAFGVKGSGLANPPGRERYKQLSV